jgi:CubicO group peptidase (beta-lactamase class C family)
MLGADMQLAGNLLGRGMARGAPRALFARLGLVAALAFGMPLSAQTTNPPAPAAGPCPMVGAEGVSRLLKPIRQKHQVPALAAAIVASQGVTAVGAVGVRKRGTEVGVTLEDQWHLGSDTKAMTATLVAVLVERRQVRWDSTVAEVFPDLAAGFNPEMKGVTVKELLAHHAGLPANLSLAQFQGSDAPREGLRAVRESLGRAPQSPPGTKYQYSNLGYIVAGAIVERITGQTWEAAMRREIFTPLHMERAGFGGTGTAGMVDQPWPHRSDGQPTAGNGPRVDNPPVLGPAGRVHCTIQDWGLFIRDQLRGARGKSALLKPDSYRTLHTPPFEGAYALGWVVAERSWGGGKVLNHDGDNTMNHATVWVAPERDFAVLVCVNQGGDTAFKACDEAVGALIHLHEEQAAAKGVSGKSGGVPAAGAGARK